MAPTKSKKKNLKKKYPIVRIFCRAEFNNTIITLTDLDGKVISWSSAGKVGFKNAKKSTPFAAQKATADVLEVTKLIEADTAHLVIKGGGMGRDAFLRALQSSDLTIESITDKTGFPFGGARAKHPRRV
jgi:small subunit ribosomal protein S11